MNTIPKTNNRTIAKNTVFLYVRMLLSIAVSLYTSRVVLQTLGVDDFGIYGVVGGIVSMFSFFNASMSGATSRFITFALGKGDDKDVEDSFASALIIHIGIALIVVLLAETIGLWLLENKLVVPEGRMNAARIVYQFSILAMAVQITQVPYNASIISYEKMDVYAYVELLNVFLKLGIVYLLLIGNFDKLILYSVLVFLVNLIIALIYRLYCIKKFKTCHFKLIFQKEKLIPMLSFSGWDLYGNMCYSVRQQGINLLINMFYGVAYNAASTVATSIQGVISGLSTNVIQAFNPQIVKNYAQGEVFKMQVLMERSLKYTLLLFLILSAPLLLVMEDVMMVWLGQVPKSAPAFCKVMLGISLFNLINNVLNIGITATGNIKRVSFISGTIYLLTVPVTYIIFRLYENTVIYAYYVSFKIMIMVVIVNFWIIKLQIPGLNIWPIIKSLLIAFAYSLIAFVPLSFLRLTFSPIINILIVFMIYIILFTSVVLIFDKQLRQFLLAIIVKQRK